MSRTPEHPASKSTGDGGEGEGDVLAALLGSGGPRRVLVWPVRDQDRLARVVALLSGLDGVEGTTIEDFDGHDLQLTAQITGPVRLTDAQRARFDRGIVGCRERAGRIELELLPSSTGRPTGDTAPPRSARRRPRAVPGPGVAGRPHRSPPPPTR